MAMPVQRGGIGRSFSPRAVACFLLLLVLFLANGCDDSTPSSSEAPTTGTSVDASSAMEVGIADGEAAEALSDPDPWTVALVMKTLTNPFFVEMERGAREAETELGVNLLVRTAAHETSIEHQIAIVDDLIRSEVDAIVIAPGDSTRLIPVLAQAREAGIFVVNIDNRLDPEFKSSYGLDVVPFISVDNEHAAFLSVRHIAERADLPAQAAIMEGIRDADNAQARLRGAERAFEAFPGITVVARETANWRIDEAYEVARDLFTAHPEVTLLFAANDMMALGAIEFLNEIGRIDEVDIAGYDAIDEAIPAILSGALDVTIDQRAAQQGYLGVEYAARLLSGEFPPTETMIDVRIVDRESLIPAP